jgi:ADP-heptose:LPS heptosyltransferase
MNRFSSYLCIFHPGAVGDGLLALKAVRVLKKRFSDHFIVWFGHKELGEILVACREVHHAYSFDDIHSLTSGNSGLIKKGNYSDLFDHCELAVGWMDDSDGRWKAYLYSAGIEATIVRSPHDPTLHAYHMNDRYLETLEPWLIGKNAHAQFEKALQKEVSLTFPNAKNGDMFDSLQGPLIILHPGSGSPHKCVPSGLLANLARGLMADPLRRLCLVGGPADIDALCRLKAELTCIEFTVLQDMDLLSISRFLKHAHLFIGHDSGLSHLAACLGIPSLLFFGPTNPSQWAPQGEHVAVMGNVCQCEGEEVIKHCSDRSCLSFSLDDALNKAENLLSGKQISVCSGSSVIS